VTIITITLFTIECSCLAIYGQKLHHRSINILAGREKFQVGLGLEPVTYSKTA
jgi:hypothetical protein